jgi:hypothetical protein
MRRHTNREDAEFIDSCGDGKQPFAEKLKMGFAVE